MVRCRHRTAERHHLGGHPALGYHYGCSGTDLYCKAKLNPIDLDYTRLALVSEAVEVFSFVVSFGRHLGWNCGHSNGEGLSRVLAGELYPARQHIDATAATWLDTGRPNWVDRTDTIRHEPGVDRLCDLVPELAAL